MATLVRETLAPPCSCVAWRHCVVVAAAASRSSGWQVSLPAEEVHEGFLTTNTALPAEETASLWPLVSQIGLFTYLFIFLLYLLVPSKHQLFFFVFFSGNLKRDKQTKEKKKE